MKKLLSLMIVAGGTLSALAQAPPAKTYAKDAELSRWVIDLNLKAGLANQNLTTTNIMGNYPNALNMNTGRLKFKDGYAMGADAQLGFFFGKNRHFGLGAGIQYMQQRGNAYLDDYHVEYQATDGAGNIFRQVVKGNNLKEEIVSNNINIPLVLKYKNRFSKHWGFTADLGALVNLQMKNRYTTRANFDYEAIYKFVQNDGGGTTSVYDNSPTPEANDWLITKDQFYRNNPNGNLQDYFSTKRALGYNVGLGMNPTANSGRTAYKAGSVGLLFQPAFNYFLSDKVALNFGAYYMIQPFKNEAQSGYRLTDDKGNYNSALNNVTASTNQNYGVNVGVRFFLGKKRTPLSITSIDQKSPTQCGVCDGSIAISGLTPNRPVNVDYVFNGGEKSKYSTTVQPDGQAKIINLCAGSYTGISVTIDQQNAAGKPVTLEEPKLRISSQDATNPTAVGMCNGTVIFNGLYAGKSATVNYDLNGSKQAAFTGIVDQDNALKISGLCEGVYTGIVITCNTCTVPGKDFTLAAPVPKPAPVPEVVEEKLEINTIVLFDFDKSFIRREFYPALNKAIREMKEDEYIYIKVDGHTDAKGSHEYNEKLAERRANAVKQYFTGKGIDASRIRMRAHGETDPAATNATDDGRTLNRRVIVLTNKKK